MATLIAFPLLGSMLVLQTSILSRLPLLLGTADLLLLAIIAWALQERVETAWQWTVIAGLMVTIVSALPVGVALAGYALTTGIALFLRQRIWRAPILAMFFTTFVGTIVTQGIDFLALRLSGHPIPFMEAVNLVVLPAIVLNIIVSIPVYGLIGDLARWLHPEALEV